MAGNIGFLGPEIGDDPITVSLKIRGTVERLAWETRDILEDAAEGAQALMYAMAPRGSTGQLAEHIAMDVDYRAGGGTMVDGQYRPGGGTYEATVGVEDFGELYPLYVYEGTGVHVGRGVIHAHNGNVMPLQGWLHPNTQKQMYTTWHAGQEPNWQWVERPRREAEEHIRREIAELDAYHT